MIMFYNHNMDGSSYTENPIPASDLAKDRKTALSLDDQIKQYESSILAGNAPDTFRGIRDKTFQDLGFDIVKEIEGKVVADIGSGLGGIAKTACVEEIDTTVYSINPHLALEEFKQTEEETTAETLKSIYPAVTAEQIQAAQAYHDSHLVTDFAHNLKSLEDDVFDVEFDIHAVNANMPSGFEALYEQTIREMLRVLKPGGRIIIFDAGREALGYRDSDEGGPLFKERVLKKMGVSFEPVYKNKNSEHQSLIGAVITKN